MHKRTAVRRPRNRELTSHQFRTFSHRDQADAAAVWSLLKTAPAVAHFQFERVGQEAKSHPSLPCPRVPGDIVQSLLQNTIHVDARRVVHWEGRTLLFIGYGNSGLPFHGGDVPVQCALEPSLVKHDRVQRLGKAAYFLQSRLNDLENFLEVEAQRGTFGSVGSSAAQHRSDRSQDLAKFVVQFTRDVAKRRLLRRDQFLRQFAATLGNFGETREETAIPTNQRQAIQQNRQERRRQKEIDLPLYAVINRNDFLSCLLLGFGVLDQESSDRCAQRRQSFLTLLRESKNAVDRVPKLVEGTGEKCRLIGSAAGGSESGFKANGVIQVRTNALEL